MNTIRNPVASIATAIILGAVGLTASVLPAVADEAATTSVAAPVEVRDCHSGSPSRVGTLDSSDVPFTVSIVNHADITVQNVTLGVNSGFDQFTTLINGPIVANATQTRQFSHAQKAYFSQSFFGAQKLSCRVIALNFSDGTQWPALPVAAASSDPAASADPTPDANSGATTSAHSQAFGLGLAPDPAGVLVTTVIIASPADNAGLKVGDVITAIAHEPVRTLADASHRLAAIAPGVRFKMSILRAGVPLVLTGEFDALSTPL